MRHGDSVQTVSRAQSILRHCYFLTSFPANVKTPVISGIASVDRSYEKEAQIAFLEMKDCAPSPSQCQPRSRLRRCLPDWRAILYQRSLLRPSVQGLWQMQTVSSECRMSRTPKLASILSVIAMHDVFSSLSCVRTIQTTNRHYTISADLTRVSREPEGVERLVCLAGLSQFYSVETTHLIHRSYMHECYALCSSEIEVPGL